MDPRIDQATANRFGPLLRHWRTVRRLSQLDLALQANVSARHVSFLETGRSLPSREMVAMLGRTLDLPLEERNALHVAARFVPPYGEHRQVIDSAPYVRQALDFVLKQQEPYPAIVIDGHWDIQLRNDASANMFAPFHRSYAMEDHIARNAMHSVFHPKGLRPFIVNWDEFAGEMIQILHREVAQGSRVSARLLEEIMAYPGVSSHSMPKVRAMTSPVLTMQLRNGDARLSFFSTFTTFAMPADAALQQLKIECFYPADENTDQIARRLAQR